MVFFIKVSPWGVAAPSVQIGIGQALGSIKAAVANRKPAIGSK
jgi:hypothetical protein